VVDTEIPDSQVVLPAGSTGMLGGRIAHHLLDRPEAALRLLVRPGGPGTADELRARIAAAHERGADVGEWIGDGYWLFMITGVTAVQDPQNHRYPEITPEPLDDIARRILPTNDEK
jgi:hypothetical protein